MSLKSIGICHYRIGKTDGVSLEIRKRKKVLEKLGYKVKLISGPIQEGADFIIPELEFDTPEILKIRHNAFEKFEDFKNDLEFEKYITKISEVIKADFLKIHSKEKFDYLFIHNIFTHGRHIASAKAFYDISHETNIKVISVNHDFYWVGSYKDIYKPTTPFIKKFLKKYVPPLLPEITHIAINSINQKALEEKIHKKALLLPDTFDFNQKPWIVDDYNRDFPQKIGIKENDIVVLQATRITRRKGIELAVNFVAKLSKMKHLLIGKKLYNGKLISKNSNVILVLAGYTEKDSLIYKSQLEEVIKKVNIKALFISDLIRAERTIEESQKKYSLWDCYVFSDIVTFPSTWEGWGNQLIEAIFAKKPIVVFEYPVFKSDITKEGYEVISLGDKALRRDSNSLIKVPATNLNKATLAAIRTLLSMKTFSTLEKNYRIGLKFHSDNFLEKKLIDILKTSDKNSSVN